MVFDSQEALVEDCGNWVDGVWSWNLLWRRRLFVWEETLCVGVDGPHSSSGFLPGGGWLVVAR